MACLRCGRETAGGETFCPDCLLDMKRHPVKPDTKVQLPTPSLLAAERKPRSRTPKTEDVVARLKRRIRLLHWLLIATLAAVAVLICLLLLRPTGETQDPEIQPTGRNFRSTQQVAE